MENNFWTSSCKILEVFFLEQLPPILEKTCYILQDIRILSIIYFISALILTLLTIRSRKTGRLSPYDFLYLNAIVIVFYATIITLFIKVVKLEITESEISFLEKNINLIKDELSSGLGPLRFISIVLSWTLFKYIREDLSKDDIGFTVSSVYFYHLITALILWLIILLRPFDNLLVSHRDFVANIGYYLSESKIDYSFLGDLKADYESNFGIVLTMEEFKQIYADTTRKILVIDGQTLYPTGLKEIINKLLQGMRSTINVCISFISYCLFYICDDWIIVNRYRKLTKGVMYLTDRSNVRRYNVLIFLGFAGMIGLYIYTFFRLANIPSEFELNIAENVAGIAMFAASIVFSLILIGIFLYFDINEKVEKIWGVNEKESFRIIEKDGIKLLVSNEKTKQK